MVPPSGRAVNRVRERGPGNASLDRGRCFEVHLEPRSTGGNGIADTLLRGTVVSMFVMKHLRADWILDPAHENTGYSAGDLARACLTRQVMLQGTFVRAGREGITEPR